MSIIFEHNAEGEADGTPVTTATSGPDQWTSVNPGANGAVEYRTPGSPFNDGGYMECDAGTGSTPTARWQPPAPIPRAWFRWLGKLSTIPASNVTFFRTSETDLTGGLSLRVDIPGGTVTLLSSTFGALWTSQTVLVLDEWFRAEVMVDTVAGEARVLLFTGPDVLGSGFTEDSGVISGTYGDAMAEVRFGISSNEPGFIAGYDEMAVSDSAWIGPPTNPLPLDTFPDAEAMVINFLRAQPEVAALLDDRIYGRLPDDKAYPLARATRVASVVVDDLGGNPLVAESVSIQLDVWGGPKAAAQDALAMIRAALGTRLLGDYSDTVRKVKLGSMSYLPDADFTPPKARYTGDVVITMRTE